MSAHKYVHFTDIAGAKGIQKTGKIWESSFGASGVFAVAQGGADVSGVQQTSMGRAKERNVAVVFTTNLLPNVAYPEEVIWHMDSLPVSVVEIIPTEEAKKYLDDSLPEDTETNMLTIPLHPAVNDADKGWTRLPEDMRPWLPGIDNKRYKMARAIWHKWKNMEKVVRFWTGKNVFESAKLQELIGVLVQKSISQL
jgi:hypothetical protein